MSSTAGTLPSSSSPSTATTKPSPTSSTKPNRLPAPTLFVGPPSRNASQLSITRTTTATDPNTLPRGKSALSRTYTAETNNSSSPRDKDAPAAAPLLKKASERQIESKWREMQNTLNEVELTAQSSTHVFGASHAAALDDLRRAQVELARAWGRGHDDSSPSSANPTGGGGGGGGVGGGDVHRFQAAEEISLDRTRKRAETSASMNTASTALSDESGSGRTGRSQLEDETALDIRLASERRAANEAYFKKVDGGVRDVVQKLEVVAEAMRGVEGESRSLWGGSTSSSGEAEGDRKGNEKERKDG